MTAEAALPPAFGNRRVRFGVLIPHFGPQASRRRIVEESRRLEEIGFDSVWVRDHLVWQPHGVESQDITFVEPLLSLAAIAAVTERITLGTGVLIPLRWPLKLAQNLAALSFLAGPRVVAGVGLGFIPAEFAAVGMRYDQRASICREMVDICRRVWTEPSLTYHGEIFHLENVALKPVPDRVIPFWYGGGTRASVRRAVEYCDGWIPGRLPTRSLADRVALLRELGDAAGKRLAVGNIPLVKIGQTRQAARAGIDVAALARSSEGAKNWVKPPSGAFETLEDMEGAIVVGSPDECVEQIERMVELGVDEVVDLRLQFEEYEQAIDLLAEHVLPAFSGSSWVPILPKNA